MPEGAVDPTFAQRAVEAENRLAIFRLVVVAQGSLTFLALMDRSATIGSLVDVLMVFSWAYSLWMLLGRPYRRWPALVSAYFTVTVDTLFIALWIYATGG